MSHNFLAKFHEKLKLKYSQKRIMEKIKTEQVADLKISFEVNQTMDSEEERVLAIWGDEFDKKTICVGLTFSLSLRSRTENSSSTLYSPRPVLFTKSFSWRGRVNVKLHISSSKTVHTL